MAELFCFEKNLKGVGVNELVLRRIDNRIRKTPLVPVTEKSEKKEEPKKNLPNPLSSDILKELLLSSLREDKVKEILFELDEIKFNGIEHFVSWYETVREEFSDPQRKALETLVQMRDAINIGCGCRRSQRLDGANNYYIDFWLSNASTDLPDKVKEITKAKIVIFLRDNKEFARF